MSRDIKILDEYLATIEKVIVTYKNDSTKEFSANDWFLFEEGVKKIAKNIEIIKKVN